MTDIIKDAKQLLEGVTSGKWHAADSDIIAEDSNKFIATVSEYSGLDKPSEEYANVQLIAAAPELAQVLAEETWEYAVQVWMDGEWLAMITCNYGTILQRRGRTFPSKKEAEEFAKGWTRGTPTRIVRRRVSPVEVVDA